MRTNHRNIWQRGQASLTLIGTLVSLTIVIILSAWYAMKVLKPAPGSHNGVPASEQAAYGAACSIYQSQLTDAVTMYKQEHNERSPTSFEQLKKYGVTNDMVRAEGCQFQLNADTGVITEIGHGQAAKNAQPIVVGGGGSATPSGGTSAPAAPATGPGGVTLPPNAGGTAPTSGGEGTE